MLGLPYTSIFQDGVQIGDRTIDGAQLKWSVFRDFPAGKMYSVVQEFVFPFIKGLHGDKNSAYSKYMGDAIFKVPTPLMLDKIVSAMDVIYEQMAHLQSADTRGDVYEYLLEQAGDGGSQRAVPHTAPYHPHDGGHDGTARGRNHLRPSVRHIRLSGGGERVPESKPQAGSPLQSAEQGALYEQHVPRLRHGPHHAAHRRDEHDDPRRG